MHCSFCSCNPPCRDLYAAEKPAYMLRAQQEQHATLPCAKHLGLPGHQTEHCYGTAAVQERISACTRLSSAARCKQVATIVMILARFTTNMLQQQLLQQPSTEQTVDSKNSHWKAAAAPAVTKALSQHSTRLPCSTLNSSRHAFHVPRSFCTGCHTRNVMPDVYASKTQ
jgi:hypothetical protein